MSEDSLGKALILTSTERTADVLDLLERFSQLSFQDVTDMITTGVWHQETQRHLLHLLQESKEHRVKSPALIPNLEMELRIAIFQSFHMSDKVGGTTGIGSLVFKRHESMPPWEVFNPNLLVRNFNEGQFGRISGLPRMGKTNLGCVLMEEVAKANKVAFSNIMPKVEDSRYQYTKDAKTLFMGIARQIQKQQQWLFILDEGGLIYSKADASTRRAKDLDKLCRVLGKLHGNMVIIEQRPDSVPTIIQEFATCLFFVHKPGLISIDLRGPELYFQTKVRDFPRTKLPFQTYDIAFFDINIDLVKMLEALSGSQDPSETLRIFLKGVS